MRRSRGGCLRRRGVQVLELLMVMPVFVLALVASVEYVPLLVTQAAITHAATVGAREAGKGANAEWVTDAVNRVLSANSIAISNASVGMCVVVEDGTTVTHWGDATLATTASPSVTAGNVRVTVCIRFDALKTNGSPVLAPYNAFGYMLYGDRFQIRALVNKEI